jgi:hypothetical protein
LLSLLTGCLVTDQIELPPVPQTPPRIDLLGYDVDDADAVILFDTTANTELIVNLAVSDEDVIETLKMRWKIESLRRPPNAQKQEYTCPGEPEIPGNGQLVRRTTLFVRGSSFAVGSCNRVDVIVSGSFKTCRPDSDPDDWDVTTQDEDEKDIGRLSFMVWAYDPASDPRVQPIPAQMLVTSCEQLEYQPPSAIGTSTSAATPGM